MTLFTKLANGALKLRNQTMKGAFTAISMPMLQLLQHYEAQHFIKACQMERNWSCAKLKLAEAKSCMRVEKSQSVACAFCERCAMSR